MQEIKDILRDLSFIRQGWYVGTTYSLAQLKGSAARAGLEPVPNHANGPVASTLRPTGKETARPGSLSSKIGTGAQPLHTDGAHMREVPDFVLLWSELPNATPTRIWRPRIEAEIANQGMFLISSGSDRFLAAAGEGIGPATWFTGGPRGQLKSGPERLRFDPACMAPADDYARVVYEKLASEPDASKVTEVRWDQANQFLLLANRLVLHGRAAVAGGDEDREITRINYVSKARSPK